MQPDDSVPANAPKYPETTAMLMVIAALTIGLGIGYTFGKNATTVPFSPQARTNAAPSSATDAATDAATMHFTSANIPTASAPMPPSPESASVLSLGGTITAIGPSSITVDAPGPPGVKHWIPSREIKINTTTAIVTMKTKDPNTTRKEGGMPYEEVPTSLADLKVGEFVTASAANGVDLTNLPSFLAEKIAASVPEAPPGQAVPPPTKR